MASFGTMIADVARSLLKRPATRPYPAEREDAPPRLRGMLKYDSSECTGCCLCMKDCPANAIELVTIDKKAKRFVMRYHSDQCIYCGQCVTSCRKGCIEMSDTDWELATTTREPFEVLYGDETDIEALMERLAAPDDDAVPPDGGDGSGK